MFEFEDSKLGRIKVVSITEARSEMATIMNDNEFNYVITKNNRPVRAIVSYDAYRRSQTGFSGKGQKSAAQKDAIKGVIQAREEDLRMLDQQKEVEEPAQKVAVGGEPSPETFTPRNPPEDTDYFAKFKKLYEMPASESLFRRVSPPNIEIVTPPMAPDVSWELPEPPAAEDLPSPRERNKNDPPSIQDLLRDLETAKLSDED